MSTALASARRRRAGPETVAPTPGVRQTVPQPSFPGSNQSLQANMAPGLTLPQVIALVDKRLNSLEVFMQTQSQIHPNQSNEEEVNEAMTQLKAVTDEYNARFDIIADELALLKDTVLKLQTFTMEVNRSLMQDRIHILSNDLESEKSPLEEALDASI
jgi:hypothetical protein